MNIFKQVGRILTDGPARFRPPPSPIQPNIPHRSPIILNAPPPPKQHR